MGDRPDVVVVTGASRGVGAGVAVGAAREGRHVVVNYREKQRRAAEVVAAVREAGADATAVQADLCDEHAVGAMFDEVSRLGILKVLVLNASGGLERHATAGYARRLNRDAQLAVARRALAIMPRGGVIVFVTSHPAHFFGRRPVPIAGYAEVAESKHAGETALRALQDEFDARGVTFVVVSGDLLEGSVALRLLQRADPDAVAARRAAGPLPTVAEFADAVVAAIDAPPTSGETIYVG
ncbi:SDR family oxidoreductase [Mycobacterium sp. PSTR-4-N]|uniref:SDR family oxidoreductase n=1 Tax=Mycobacterium sp. PSTR-4-N TaxID=2917745 RepID=UPI001F1554B1|nr:SDR family oxidoreductase [Mycobacterium sp. PSTR-4-N]MCG7593139.1 SDR family oxidoreductase [Mycobacterium sp. PSTR-4-N]